MATSFLSQQHSNGFQYSQQPLSQPTDTYPHELQSPLGDLIQQPQLQTLIPSNDVSVQNGDTGPKRLHVTNIPFRFREHDLKQMFEVCTLLLSVLERELSQLCIYCMAIAYEKI